MGLEFRPKLSVILAVAHNASAALSYIITKGDVIVMILRFVVSTGITARLNDYTDQEK